ncbi:hypothetical protein IFT48_02565 [Pseudomonas fluorescens]|uniref:hypothetical protein n=1 Tax=Pseudomonas TaxID=286 RepID=UPI000F030F7D|nr:MULTISPECIES: hypothetical protein [Pseudomonas]MBD8088848.1 hypothetical protein [Pseudomonas fluorescens]MBD8614686.1 hypothetical protein [Pseudomonas putida]
MSQLTAPSYDALIDGISLKDPDGCREFLARVFKQRLQRQDFTRYITDDLAGDFAGTLTAYLAPMIKAADEPMGVVLVPFQVGNTYQTLEGKLVRFVKVHNEGNSYESMEDESGVNRYTRRDFGRVCGTDHNNPDPRNVLPLYQVPGCKG